jgi:hypothetical protein
MIWIGFGIEEGGHKAPTHLLMITMSFIAFSGYILRALFFIGFSVLGFGLLVMFFGRRTSGFSTAWERLIN